MTLDLDPAESLVQFLAECRDAGFDPAVIKREAEAALSFQDGGPEPDAQRRWYASIIAGAPDYSIYERVEYLGELWACWIMYSRWYLNYLRRDSSLPERQIAFPGSTESGGLAKMIGPVSRILDLGCGFGYSTAGLMEVFPGATAIGTNVGNAPQTVLARHNAERYGFTLRETLPEAEVDLVFASEYFEHFYRPLDHLKEVLALRPRALLIANSFGVAGLGHFPFYEVGGLNLFGEPDTRGGTVMESLFRTEMIGAGYKEQETGLWNQRPTYWRRK